MSDEAGVVDATTILRTTTEIACSYSRSKIRAGDLVCSIGPSYGKVMVVPDWLTGGNLTQGTARIAVSNADCAKFIFWALRCEASVSQWEAGIGGATFRALNLEPLAKTWLARPPRDEQSAIAAFLDRETAKIDSLITEQGKLLRLLDEKRRATISHAVTSGLDPNSPLKDSGIPWLGLVPMHWGVRSISSLSTKITNGYVGPTRDILQNEGVRYLQSLHIKNNVIRFDSPYYVSQEWSDMHQKSILEKDDVLIVQTGDIGQSAVVSKEFAGCNCHALIIVSPIHHELDGRWLSWVLNSDYGVQSLLSIQTGALHPHLNCGNVKGLYVPLPPMYEQAQIIDYVESILARFDTLREEARQAIRLLNERRSALIAAAVTGKIDVRVSVEESAG